MEEIKAGDIMVGNWVNVLPHNKPSQIIEIKSGRPDYKDYVRISSPNLDTKFATEIKNIKGIPLTEDILLKAGATKIGEKLYKFRYAFIIHETSSCFVIRMESEEGRFWNVMPFSYLHQLQNIYRLCMNQDLKVDL